MKKSLIFILSIALIVILTVSAVSAQSGKMALTADKSSVYAGATITVTVKVTGVSAAKSIGIIPSFDEKVFELVSGEWLVTGAALSDFSGGTATIAYASARAFNENVFKFTLKVKSNASLGSFTVGASASIKNGSEEIATTVSGAKITVACNHSYSKWSSASSSQHTRTCSKCGAVEKKSHSFDNACDTTCNDCGYKRSITHSYKTVWSSNSNSHWHECSVCKDKKDVASHIPGPAATETTPQTCTVCGYVIAKAQGHTHTFDKEWHSDANGHWNVCTSCKGKSEVSAHVYDNSCDTTCNTCGYERKTEHTFGSEYSSDDNAHWNVCTVCGAKGEQTAHTYDNECDVDCNDCGHIRETEHKYDKGNVTVAPTEGAAGEKVYTCEECGHTKTVELELVYSGETGSDETDKGPTDQPDESGTNAPGSENTEKEDDTDKKKGNGVPIYVLVIVAVVCLGAGFAIGFLIKRKR